MTIKSKESCDGKTAFLFLEGNFQHESEFFVFTGVTSMVYCLAILVLYILLHESYTTNGKYPSIVRIFI